MVGVPELFLERPCFSPISCSDGSLYIHTGKQNYKTISGVNQHRPGLNELLEFDFSIFRIFRSFRTSFIGRDIWISVEK